MIGAYLVVIGAAIALGVPLVLTFIVVTAVVAFAPGLPRTLWSVGGPPAAVAAMAVGLATVFAVVLRFVGGGSPGYHLPDLALEVAKALAYSLPQGAWAALVYAGATTLVALVWPGLRDRAPWLLTSGAAALGGAVGGMALLLAGFVAFRTAL